MKLDYGLHRNIRFDDYQAIEAVNQSKLKDFGITPKHALHKMKNEKSDSMSLMIGHATHTAILEPELYDDLYTMFDKAAMLEECGVKSINANAYKAAKKAWDAEHADCIVIPKEADENAKEIRKAVHAHPIAHEILSGNGANEVTLLTDLGDGYKAKARLDRITRVFDFPSICDLKTISPWGESVLSPRVIERQIKQMGYHCQAAWYVDRMNQIESSDWRFIFIFVENEEPFDVVCYEIDPDAIEQGRRENRDNFAKYRKAVEQNDWPGYSNRLLMAGLPHWAYDQTID